MKREKMIDHLIYCKYRIIAFKYYRKDKNPYYFKKQVETTM